MRSTEVFFFCSLYLLFFFMLGSLIGVTTFPPPPQWIGFTIKEFNISFGVHLSFWDMAALLITIASAVGLTIAAGIKIFGSGVSFDQSFVVTIVIALFVGSLLAWTMSAMLVDVPIYVSAVLVWPFIGLLMYSVISMARGGGG